MTVQTPALPESTRAPKDDLFRASIPGLELRAATDEGGDEGPVMFGHFVRWNEWTEINSIWEGRFMERFAPGSTKKTIRENRDSMRVLFQHGYDPSVGDKPLGPIDELAEDSEGAAYAVPLLDARYVMEDVLPGLEAGLYGVSFRFRIMREEWVEEPGVSDHNPDGLPERTVKEAQVKEFGPVTFPAYPGSTASIRSISDELLLGRFARDPERLRQIIADAPALLIGGAVTTYQADPPCAEPVRAGSTYYVRCGKCAACRAAAERPEETSPPGAGAEPHSGTPEPDGNTPPAARASQDNAPPKDGAGAEPHSDRGSRDTQTPLFGQTPRKEKPSWLL